MTAGRAVGSAPGKVFLVGEHAVVRGQPAFTLPFPSVEARVRVTPRDGASWLTCPLYDGALDGVPASLSGLAALVEATFEAIGLPPAGVDVAIESTIPAGAGLGSSAAVAAAVARALATAHGVELPADRLEQLVHISERHAHGNPSGVDGRTVVRGTPLRFVKGESESPAIAVGGEFHLLVAATGQSRDTRTAVAAVSAFCDADPARGQALLDELGGLTEAAVAAWRAGDVATLGGVMNSAQEALRQLGVSAPSLERLIDAARQAGAVGAKLTGAGMGGCILALAPGVNDVPRIEAALRDAGAAGVWSHAYGREDA